MKGELQRVSPNLLEFYESFKKKSGLNVPFSKFTAHIPNLLKDREGSLADNVRKGRKRQNEYRVRPSLDEGWL